MDIIKTGLGLTRTIKNAARFREILTVFAKNGFDESIIQFNLHNKIPGFALPKKRILASLKSDGAHDDFWDSLGYRLRKSFEELGPSFIKFGQLLSTREDLLHPDLIAQLKTLQDNVKGVDFPIIKKILEESFGEDLSNVFKNINETPIGVASMGLVYQANLINGDDVVVKVRRPNIEKNIKIDFEIIAFISSSIEKISDEVKFLGLSRAIEDFFKSINLELNFLIEAQNCNRLRENISKQENGKIFVIPKVYSEYTKSNVLVSQRLIGNPFNSLGANATKEIAGMDQLLADSVKMFIHSLLVDGFFHADLHGGNFFLLDDGRIGIIDFGLMGSLSKKARTSLVAVLFSLVTNNYENLVYEFLDIADYESIPDYDVLAQDISDTLAPHLGLGVQQIDVTALVHSLVTTLSKHKVYLPRDWFIIFRSLMTLDGVGKSINIDLNIFEIIDDQIHDVMSELVTKESLVEEAVWIGRDALNSMRVIPRHIKWLLKELSKKQYTFDISIKGVEGKIENLSNSIFFMGLVFLSSVFIFSGVFLLSGLEINDVSSIPNVCWILWGCAMATMFRAALFVKK